MSVHVWNFNILFCCAVFATCSNGISTRCCFVLFLIWNAFLEFRFTVCVCFACVTSRVDAQLNRLWSSHFLRGDHPPQSECWALQDAIRPGLCTEMRLRCASSAFFFFSFILGLFINSRPCKRSWIKKKKFKESAPPFSFSFFFPFFFFFGFCFVLCLFVCVLGCVFPPLLLFCLFFF